MEAWSFPPAYDESYRPPPDQAHWFTERETMDPDERDVQILHSYGLWATLQSDSVK